MSEAQNHVLFQREEGYIPRVGAVHDLCGYGKCSLGVAIPVLSAAGCDVCPVPTSLFSAHTKFPEFYMFDTTEMLTPYLDAWEAEGIELDAIYSGFLGAADQVASIKRLYETFPKALRVLDPVMGDGGQIYATYTPELCEAMRELVDGADILTPNLTEAAFLARRDYLGKDIPDAEVQALIDALLAQGVKHVVLKGIVRDDKYIRNFVASSDNPKPTEIVTPLLPYMLHGTGDLFASALLSAVMCGRGLVEAAEFASNFVIHAMEITRKQPNFELRGVSFESILGEVCALVK